MAASPGATVITIDGPASSGKSTLGEVLAQRLGYVYFDTGVMYRALTLAALQQAHDLHDAAGLEALAARLRIEVLTPTHDDGRQYTVLADGQDVTWAIRDPAVDRNVSLVSSYPGVRAELIRQQRSIGWRGQVVMVGRDIGTVVMPEAPLKIFLEASLDERARRRTHDQQARGGAADYAEVRAELARRDEQDKHVMQPASDAVLLSSDDHTPQEIVAHVLALLDERRQAAP
jgi:cytidylate kinase